MERWLKVIVPVLLLGCFCSAVFSQTTGKISGTVIDGESGEPLPGANVMIRGTSHGAAADLQGEFYLINVPPGSYEIEARMMGYATMLMKNVRIYVNRTTPVDFSMHQSVIQGEVVTVQADKIVLKKDQTSSIRNITSEEIERLPAENISTVVRMQPGVVGNNFRGGRDNEVTYLIDGVAITDAYNNTARTSNVNPEVVEDVEVITGTFNAEYGNAMSGVVNVITKDGSNALHGNFSANLGNYMTPHKDIFKGIKDSEFDRIKDYKGSLSGSIVPDKLFFVVNGRYNKNLGYLTAERLFNVDDYSDFSAQEEYNWYYEHTGDSAIVPFNWGEYYDGFAKLTYKPFHSFRVTGSLTWNKGDGKSYSHSARFNPDGRSPWHNETTMGSLHINQMFGRSAFYELKASYSDYWTGGYLYEDPLDSRYIHDQYRQSDGTWFQTGGQDKGHSNRTEKKENLKFDFTYQVNKQHSLKAGLDFTRINLNQEYHTIRNAFEGTGIENDITYTFAGQNFNTIDEIIAWIDTTDLAPGRYYLGQEYLNYEPIIYGNESTHTDMFEVTPVQFSCYLQDKMEFDLMVVNLGLRFDYFNPKTVYPSDYRNPGNQTDLDNPDRLSTYIDADPKYQVSPRLGLSYDLHGVALLRFAYGHFLQLPPLNYFYQNSAFVIGTSDFGTTMGNAQLNPQKTIQYEVGLFQQLTDNMNMEIAVWYKDIYDLVTAEVKTTYSNRRYGLYTNKDYGNARGLELKYDFKYDAINVGLNYTFSYAKGVADNARSTFDRAGNQQDPVNKLINMGWDQRHTLNLTLGYNKMNYGATILGYYNSNQPYTWSPIPQSSLFALNMFPNNQYKPSRISADLNAFYNLGTYRGISMRLTLLVYNLFDTLNENGVNGETGRAYTAIVQDTDLSGYRSLFSTYEDTYQNPSAYSSPREVKLGLGFTF
ncbi:TonB-dependent receptor [bacterium]|nr:TonB-dependent receptor [bacterium]